MQRASDLFSNEQRKQVEQAVVDAESKTSAEIVPVVATASGRYDRAEDMIGLWLAAIAAVLVWVLFPRQAIEASSWAKTPLVVELLVLIAAVVLAFVVGAVVGSRIGWLRRLFTPRKQMEEEVASRAREVFFDNRIHHTAGSTGILFYISLYEHMAAVLADQDLLEKLGQEAIDRLCKQLTEQLRGSNPTEALCGVISEAGQLLAGPLPRAEDDVNELQDSLVLLD